MRAALARVGVTVDAPVAASASVEWAALGLRLVAALWWYWFVRDYLSEGRRWLEGTLALDVYCGHDAETGDAAHRTRAARAKALRGAGILASQQGDYGRAGTLLGEAIALSKAAGDRKGVAGALNSLGRIAQMQGDYARAAPLYEESLVMQRALGNGQGIAGTLNNLGLVAYMRGEHARGGPLRGEPRPQAGGGAHTGHRLLAQQPGHRGPCARGCRWRGGPLRGESGPATRGGGQGRHGARPGRAGGGRGRAQAAGAGGAVDRGGDRAAPGHGRAAATAPLLQPALRADRRRRTGRTGRGPLHYAVARGTGYDAGRNYRIRQKTQRI